MSKRHCTYRKGKNGEHVCDCEVCRFSARDLQDAPTISKANPDPDDFGPHDPSPEEPNVYDLAHDEAQERPPTVQIGIDLADQLRGIIADVKARLPKLEHTAGRRALQAVSRELESSATACEKIADLVHGDLDAAEGMGAEDALAAISDRRED